MGTRTDSPQIGRESGVPLVTTLFSWVLAAVTLVLLVGGLRSAQVERMTPVAFGSWLALVAIADFHTVSIKRWAQFSLSLPPLLAVSMTTSPGLAGLVALLAYVDRRELRGEWELCRAVFNRSQVTLSVMAASFVFHAVGGDVMSWPSVIAAAAVCIAADCLVNIACVASVNTITYRRKFRVTVRDLFPEQGVRGFVATYLCLGMIGLAMATVFEVGGVWGLLVSFAPIFIAAKMLEREQRLAEAKADLRRKDQGLRAATERMESERRDERGVLAGSLHDDVLPPLFKVQLMVDVVRRDLETGALLDLEGDLPMVIEAAEATSQAIRDLIGDLRQSSLGPGGLISTLRLRVRDIESRTSVRVQLRIESVPTDSAIELVAYQVAREAVENAARHGEADLIVVRLGEEADGFRLTVTDDGAGFDSSRGSPEGHFGLSMMWERVKAIGGVFDVQSEPGRGCVVRAWLPAAPVVAPEAE